MAKTSPSPGTRLHPRPGLVRVGVLGVVTLIVALTGCGTSTSGNPGADAPAVRTGELPEVAGEPCPPELPIADDPSGHGFGVEHPAELLPALRSALDNLELLSPDQACTADLGPRWMIVYSHAGDLTGVLVDDYGCRDVRLTDDPHATPPGAVDQDGTVGGLLGGGSAVLEAVGLGRSE